MQLASGGGKIVFDHKQARLVVSRRLNRELREDEAFWPRLSNLQQWDKLSVIREMCSSRLRLVIRVSVQMVSANFVRLRLLL